MGVSLSGLVEHERAGLSRVRAVARAELDALLNALEQAYRGDRFHALLGNLEDVSDEEWAAVPAEHRVEVFGTAPHLSIADLAVHVGGAKLMWENHPFGDGALTWEVVGPRSRDRGAVMAWLDEAHGRFVASVGALGDDGELGVERMAHWGQPLETRRIVSIVVNHDLYHSGEINRQRSLIRGAQDWRAPEG